MNQYNTLFIGHPIWHGKLPKIIYTFLETYDLANYTIIPFCTSGSTGITTSLNEIKDLEPQAIIKEGKRFSTNASQAEVSEWIDSLQLNIKGEEEMEKTLNIHVNQQTLQAQLENNSSVNALLEELKNKNITLSMNDYGNFEKVGSLGLTLPRNDKQITTKPGDIILYQGNQLTIYYDTNTWNFTKIGSIPNMTRESMLDFLGIGPIQVTLSIN